MTRNFHDIKRLLATMVLSAVVALGALAQVDAAFSHFWVGPSYYNPAAAGEFRAAINNAIFPCIAVGLGGADCV